jgi:hypothetical protein
MVLFRPEALKLKTVEFQQFYFVSASAEIRAGGCR